MLRACHRVLAPHGRLAFLAIQPTPGLAAPDRRRAHRAGPAGVAVRTSYESLLKTAGFVEIGAKDLTSEYRSTQAGWMEATARRADAVRAALGDVEYEERMANRHRSKAAIDAGLLSRFMYWARR